MKARRFLSTVLAAALLTGLFLFSGAAAGPALPGAVALTEGDILPDFITEGSAQSDDSSIAWVDDEGNLRALREGSTDIHYGEKTCTVTVADYEDGSPVVGQLKLLARYKNSMPFYDGHVYFLFTSYRDGVTLTVNDLRGGYEISELYYEDIRKDISYGSNHNKATAAEDYFTFREGMTSVTLDCGEVVTIGMCRDLGDIYQATLGGIQNSSLWNTLSNTAKAAEREILQGGKDALPSVSEFGAFLKQFADSANQDYNDLLDGFISGGVYFNRELYEQKLDCDQFENVTYELDITQNQLNDLTAALEGNLNRFSVLKNGSAAVSLRAWNTALGMREGKKTAYYLESPAKRIGMSFDSPRNVKNEIKKKLPGCYLNNSRRVEEPNAGFQDDTGWVYVSGPEVLSLPGEAGDGRLRISVTGGAKAADVSVFYLNGNGQEVELPLWKLHEVPAGVSLCVRTDSSHADGEFLLKDITMNDRSILDSRSEKDGVTYYTVPMPDGNARLDLVYEKAVVHTKGSNHLQVAVGDSLKVSEYAYLAEGKHKTKDLVWKVLDGPLALSEDRKTLTAKAAGTAVAWMGAAGNENIGVLFTVEIFDSLKDMVKVTFNEDERYSLRASLDGAETVLPFSGYLVKKGSVLTLALNQQDPEVLSLVAANLTPVSPGNGITVNQSTWIQAAFQKAKIVNMPQSIHLQRTGETYALEPSVRYSNQVASLLPVYDRSISYRWTSDLISVDEKGLITVTGEIPQEGAAVIVTAYAGSSNDRVYAQTKVILGSYQGTRTVGRLAIASLPTADPSDPCAFVTLTAYEDMDLDVSYYSYMEPTSAYHRLMEDYRDHPENYASDPALYDATVKIEDRDSYFINHLNGAESEPETISLRAGEGISFASRAHDEAVLTVLRKTLESENLASSQDVQALIEDMKRFSGREEMDGTQTFDSLLTNLIQIFLDAKTAGQNSSMGGLNINHEVYQQFMGIDSIVPNLYYTVEITADQLARLQSYVANPKNNDCALFVDHCGNTAVELWNAALSDRPDLQLTTNSADLMAEPDSLSMELSLLAMKTGQQFSGTGEGGGKNFYPRISPAWAADVTDTPAIQEKKSISPTVTIEGWHFGESPKTPVLGKGSNPGGGKVTFTYKIKGTEDSTYTETVPTAIGSYTVRAEIAETGQYQGGWATADFTISGGSTSGGGASSSSGGTSSDDSSDDSSYDSSGATPATASVAAANFLDVPKDAYYSSAVAWAVAKGITTGTGEGQFSPNMTCTRAQMVTFLWRAAGSPEHKGKSMAFSDVPAGSYYEKAVLWADEVGITTGVSASRFAPNDVVTRAQVVLFLFRYEKGASSSESSFADVPTDTWYTEGVSWAVGKGITKGVDPTHFAPDNHCTRAEIVTFLYRDMFEALP